MPVYLTVIRKHDDGSYRVSFPDLPGLATSGDTLDEAIDEAVETLEDVAENWVNADGSTTLPKPRTIDELSADPAFVDAADGATIAEIDYEPAG